ncbi:MAG: GspH/FimT family protein [Nevskia sp.]|nr:GspH/FimT family protein [Nevskia sp.]
MSEQRGFTLLELMIVVAIAAVLLAIAGPGLRSFFLSGARGDAAAALYGAMVQARAEAISRNNTITLCPRAAATSTSYPRCASGGTASWADGWVIYRDSAPNTAGSKPSDAADILAVGEPIDAVFDYLVEPASTSVVQFEPSGRLGASSRVNLRLCKTGDSSFDGRRVSIDPNGRIRLARDSGCSV